MCPEGLDVAQAGHVGDASRPVPAQREFRPYPFDFKRRSARAGAAHPARQHAAIVIVGGGIGGLTLALNLAAQGMRSVVLEADDSVCFGSRAICFSRRSLEIFKRIGVAGAVLAQGLAWQGGRSYHRNAEVLHFTMPHDALQEFPPMVNLQQYRVEDILVDAIGAHGDLVDLRWQSRVEAVRPIDDGRAATRPPHAHLDGTHEVTGDKSAFASSTPNGAPGVELDVDSAEGRYTLSADWVVACDGGRSTVRDALGLRLEGTAYEGRYVVADILLRCALPTERLAWFDPPSNPGSTILMHRQPDDIWRIDYQIRDDEDPAEAVRPDNVLPRVEAHLAMIGITAPWWPVWITLYKANALTLPCYRDGRVLLLGDAAHLVPIFGVRGANSTIDDADNLAWKLALVSRGRADAALLDSYSSERVQAARENLAHGRKSTEFMAPPNFAYETMRTAVLTLSAGTPALRPLINPRQSSALRYDASPLNAGAAGGDAFSGGPVAGSVLPCAPVMWQGDAGPPAGHITDVLFAGAFTVFHFQDTDTDTDAAVPEALRVACERLGTAGLTVHLVSVRRGAGASGAAWRAVDASGAVFRLYGVAANAGRAVYAVRPDGHVLGGWSGASCAGREVEDAIRYCLAPRPAEP